MALHLQFGLIFFCIAYTVDFAELATHVPETDTIDQKTLFNGNLIIYNQTLNWKSPIILANNGIAHIYPDYWNKNRPMISDYTEWGEVDSIMKLGNFRMIININEFTYEFFGSQRSLKKNINSGKWILLGNIDLY